MAAIAYANRSARPVDLWTTRRRVAHRVHRRSSSSRPEQNEKCVTHVAGQKCYPCPRLLRGEHLCWKSSMFGAVGLPHSAFADEDVGEHDKLSGDGNDGELGGFSSGDEAIEGR